MAPVREPYKIATSGSDALMSGTSLPARGTWSLHGLVFLGSAARLAELGAQNTSERHGFRSAAL